VSILWLDPVVICVQRAADIFGQHILRLVQIILHSSGIKQGPQHPESMVRISRERAFCSMHRSVDKMRIITDSHNLQRAHGEGGEFRSPPSEG
jgi:hypothetical protein